MSIKEYLEKLYKIKAQAQARWGSFTPIESAVVDGSFGWLVDNLEIKRGEIKVDEDLARIMDDFLSAVISTINSVPLYQSKLKLFLGDLTTIQNNNKLFHNTTNNFNIETAGVNNVQKAVVGEIIEQYTGNGLNAHFVEPLKDGIYRNILAGANMREVKQVLQSYILSGQDQSGKLHSYIDQTAQQAVDSYTGAINQQLVKDFDFTGYIISGSLIETSSKQCIEAVEQADQQFGYLSFEDWEKILDIARNNPKAKLIPGTDLKNLPLNKLHWGCRHDFTPVVMTIPKNEKKPKPAVEPPKPVDTPPAPPKPKETAKKKPEGKKKEPVNKPAEGKTPYVKATTKQQAKQVSKAILEKNAGLNVDKITVAGDLTLDLYNQFNKILDGLTTEYNISPAIDKSQPFNLKFSSNTRHYGSVQTLGNGSRFMSINFGHLTDNNRATEVSDDVAPFRSKSRVDLENQPFATVVHEFGHVISTSRQTPILNSKYPAYANFWNDLYSIKKLYQDELVTLTQAQDKAGYAKIFLGKYASTNLSEFMAEAFTEYRLSSKPSKYAEKVGLLIDKYFKK